MYMRLDWVISITTGILIVYLFSAGFGLNYSLVISLFLLVNVAFLWMVFKILKAEKPPEKSFENYFYEDWNYKRNNPEK